VMGTVHVLEAHARSAPGAKPSSTSPPTSATKTASGSGATARTSPWAATTPTATARVAAELVSAAYRILLQQATQHARGQRPRRQRHRRRRLGADRLVPDILRAFEVSRASRCIRNPHRHPPLAACAGAPARLPGLAERLYTARASSLSAEGWNFGPATTMPSPCWIVEHSAAWGQDASWQLQHRGEHPHEATYLKLDISKARQPPELAPRAGAETGPCHSSSTGIKPGWRNDMRRFTWPKSSLPATDGRISSKTTAPSPHPQQNRGPRAQIAQLVEQYAAIAYAPQPFLPGRPRWCRPRQGHRCARNSRTWSKPRSTAG
jgi:hypothetical protein